MSPRPPQRKRNATAVHGVARGLGWFSIGLGVAELVFSRRLASALGMLERESLVRAYGLREIASGIAILASPRDPSAGVWSRVGGDALDLATLVPRVQHGASGDNAVKAIAAVAGMTVLDLACAAALTKHRNESRRPVHDYSDRSGWPRGLPAARAAAGDYEAPRDMRVPAAMRPLET